MFELTPELVLRGYACGIFPMAESRDDPELFWVDPEMRGIIPFDRFHVPRKLARRVRSGVFEVRCDTAFADVIAGCAETGKGRRETWINDQIVTLYTALHRKGHVHSIECWRDGRLAGGLYGVVLGGAFFGESMFSRETDASKVALVHLVDRLRRGGFRLLDTQFVTPHLRIFGAIEVPRTRYHELLRDAIEANANFYPDDGPGGGGAVGAAGTPDAGSP
ncbi:MAG: leucyl/phenylalanyl-tRNA--protein transferase [Alphaproteobacteria bacterium]